MEERKDAVDHSVMIRHAANVVCQGRCVLLHDEQTGACAYILAAQFACGETFASLLRTDSVSISVVLAGARLDTLGLSPELDTGPRCRDAVTEDARLRRKTQAEAVDTSSCATLAAAIQALVDPGTMPGQLVLPAGLSLIQGLPGGILKRRALPEAALELMQIAGLEPGAIICQIGPITGQPVDGTGHTLHFAGQEVPVISLAEIVLYRQMHRMSLTVETQLPTAEATFRLRHYTDLETGAPYLVLLLGDVDDKTQAPPLVRLHSSCTTGDIFGSLRCDCQAQMHAALHAIALEQRGVFLYLPQEGRGIGLVGKLHTYVLQEQGYDTVEANLQMGYPVDARSYAPALEILHDLHISQVRLLTNNPEKVQAVQNAGIAVTRVQLEIPPVAYDYQYLQTKMQRMGHFLTIPDPGVYSTGCRSRVK